MTDSTAPRDMSLRRELGFWDAVATGIAAMVGAGIFVVSGIGARIAGLAVVAVTVLNIRGIRATTNASKIMVVIKIGVLSLFALLGAGASSAANFEPFAPSGITGVVTASAIVFFAYTGYARIATLGEEI